MGLEAPQRMPSLRAPTAVRQVLLRVPCAPPFVKTASSNIDPGGFRHQSRGEHGPKAAMSEWRRKSEGPFVCQQRSAERFEQDAVERIGLWVVFGVPLDAKGK
jgi:hypothetical protein